MNVKEKPALLRKGSSTKMALKSKIVQIYEAFFRGEDVARDNPNFWDELFLLKVNSQFIEGEFEKLTVDQLAPLRENINALFRKCVDTLQNESNPIIISNAMQTICALVKGVIGKQVSDFGFDAINLLVGFEAAEAVFQNLIESLNAILSGEQHAVPLKNLALSVVLTLVTATDNISQNTVLEYLMMNSMFESMLQLLEDSAKRTVHGPDAVLLLTLLVQYRKNESMNPYSMRLSILKEELALNGLAQVVSSVLTEFNRAYILRHSEPEGGFFTTISNYVGSMFVDVEKQIEAIKANDSILLALYEAIHLNRNFITTLTYSHTPSSTPTTPPSSPTTKQPEGGGESEVTALADSANQPTNLLVTFLEYSSITMQSVKEEAQFHNAKLCLIILTCISEDQYANSLMHDVNMNFRVPLHKMPMRHRRAHIDRTPVSRPLVAALLDLLVEFMASHMMKNMPYELYMRCIGIVHRVLCYQKKCRMRLQYNWKNLWTASINLLKFLLAQETHLLKNNDIFLTASRIVNIFNLFITFGDTFLPNPTSYDELYYELIRMHQVFDNLYSMALRHTTNDGQWRDSAARLTSTLVNIRAIVNHFTPKVDSWSISNNQTSLSEDQVLDVVRANYDTLTLKLQDNLDQYDRYAEKPKETSFFTNLVRSIVCDVRRSVSLSSQQHHASITKPAAT